MSPGATPQTTATPAAAVRVRLFAALREQAGWSSRELALTGATATPQAIWGMLQLGDGGPSGIRVAINHQFAGWEDPLRDGDELAFLPPITGG